MKITLGKGLRNPHGFRFEVPDDDLVAKFENDSPVEEAWWSPHVFEGDRRRAAAWIGSQVVAIDVDARVRGEKVEIDPWLDPIERGFDYDVLPGSVFHPTPHGFRLLFLLDAFVEDRAVYLEAVEGALRLTREGVDALGLEAEVELEIDAKVSRDLARLFWHPSAIVDGVERKARFLAQEDDDGNARRYSALALAREGVAERPQASPPPPPPPPRGERRPPPPPPPGASGAAYDEAARAWLERHPEATRRLERAFSSGECPACGHGECFRPFREGEATVPGRWVCYSTDHGRTARGCGVETPKGDFVGDALDVAAFLADRHPLGLLVDEGLLEEPGPKISEAPQEIGDGRTKVFVPRSDPLGVSISESTQAVLEALPEGTLYRFGPVVGTLARSPEGDLVHRALSARGAVLEAERAGVVFMDYRYRQTSKTYEEIRTVPRTDVGAYVLEAALDDDRTRGLRGVYTAPIFAGDFAPMRPGWNQATGIFLDLPADLVGFRPALHLTTAQAYSAVREFLEDFSDVVEAPDLANAVGLLVTLLVRPSIVGPVPLHLALATTEGSGKTTLVDTFAGGLVHGKPAAHLRQTSDENEFAKTVFSYARRGTSFLCLDNVAGGSELDSPLLAELVTATTIEARVLGVSEAQRFQNDFVLAATGNNVSLSPEVLRRTIPIRFEPQVALRDRRFRHGDPVAWVRQKRKAVLEVLVGAVERWKVAGRPPHPSGRTAPGFPAWSRAVGGIVGLLGFEEWLEDLDRFHDQGSEWDHAAKAFLAAWYGDPMVPNEAQVSNLLPLISDDPGALGVSGRDEAGLSASLGKQIRKMEGRPTLLPYRVESLKRTKVARRYRVTKED